ncbi:unnamed protein product [Taenia asiatica]|uniref:Translation initiation factor IF-2 n=1 Tax=Taenia asiatica TaxID=60517 RepID=A0A0R3W874_TAEAS|nr:unnamed protein product [Taenia asiatica]
MADICKKTTLRTRLVYCSGKAHTIQVVCKPRCQRLCGSPEQSSARRGFDPSSDQPSRNGPDDKISSDSKRLNQEANVKVNLNPATDYNGGRTQQRMGKSSSDERGSNEFKRSERDNTKKGNFPPRSSKNDAKKRTQPTSPSNSDERASNDSKLSGRGSSGKRTSVASSGKRDTRKRSHRLSPPNTAEKSSNESKRSLYDDSKKSNPNFMTGRSDTKGGSQQKGQPAADEKASNGEKGGDLMNPTTASTLGKGVTKKGVQSSEQPINAENTLNDGSAKPNSIAPNGRNDARKGSQMTGSPVSGEESSLNSKNQVTVSGTRTDSTVLGKMGKASTQETPSKDADETESGKMKKGKDTHHATKNGAGGVGQASLGSKSPNVDNRGRSNESRKANINGVENENIRNGTGQVSQAALGPKSTRAGNRAQSDDSGKANIKRADNEGTRNDTGRASQASSGPRSPKIGNRAQSDDPRKATTNGVDNEDARNGTDLANQASLDPSSPKVDGKTRLDDPKKANINVVDKESTRNGTGRVSQASSSPKSPKLDSRARSDNSKKANVNRVDHKSARNKPSKGVGQLAIGKKSSPGAETFDPGNLGEIKDGVQRDEIDEAGQTSPKGKRPEELDRLNEGGGTVVKGELKTPRGVKGAGPSGLTKGSSTTSETKDSVKKQGSRPIHSAPDERHLTDFPRTGGNDLMAGRGFYRNHPLGSGKSRFQQKSHPSLDEKSQGDENRTEKGRRTPNSSDRFARMEGAQYGYIDLVKALEMLDRNAVYYYIYVFLHQRDVDKELLPFEKRRCIEKALETASNDEEERLRLCILNSKDRRLSKVELTTGCKIEMGELTGVENCYRGLPRRRLTITGPSYAHIANAISMMEQYFPRLMRNAAYPYPLPRGTTTKYETEEHMASTALQTVDHEPGNIGLRADFNDRALVTCRQVREAYEGS